MKCSNYRTVAPLNHVSTVLMMVLQRRLKVHVQAAPSLRHNTKANSRKANRKGIQIHHYFIDFQKALDTIGHGVIWATLKSLWSEEKIIKTHAEYSRKCAGSSKSR